MHQDQRATPRSAARFGFAPTTLAFGLALSAAFALAAVASAPFAARAEGEGQTIASGAWPVYGGDNTNQKYSPLDQINKDNAKSLAIAWRWASLDETSKPPVKSYRFEATPIVVGGRMYASLSSSRVVALNPATGELIWFYDPKSYETIRRPTNLGWVHRGVAYWTDGADERIFIGTGDAMLVALNAKTGEPIADWGNAGKIDLTEGLRRPVDRKVYAVTSPPVVCNGVVAVGSSIFDGPTQKEMPPGDVRGFDVKTGKIAWTFHTVAQPGEFGADTWEDGANDYTGNANVWSIMAADDELGYLYLPVGTPTSDWYGGHRHGDGLFGECLVCLNAKTGERIWHFQTVHHGVWDYDPPAAPVLCDIVVDGKKIKAVAQISKQGFTYVFDRATGKPVWPIEERPVPQSTIEGEKSSPTQPFPTKPAPYERQGMTEDDLIDLTPELKAEAIEILKRYDHGPLFTPPTEKGAIEMPGWQGGGNWGGAPFDPESGTLFVPSTSNPIRVALSRPDPARSNLRFNRAGTMDVMGPKGGASEDLPLCKPPWGRITAINLNTGDHVWMKPHGKGPKNHPAIAALKLGDLGSQQRAGAVVTKTLLFAAEAAAGMGNKVEGNDPLLRGFDKKTGEIVSEFMLPAFAGGTPMTYSIGGKQYIAVAVGGGKEPSEIIALALP